MNLTKRGNGIIAAVTVTLILVTVLLVFPTRADASSAPIQSVEAGYSAVLYNSTDGLPTSEANSIVQTGNGFIYIGSYGGLVRCDGVNFTRFDASTGITSVVSLFVDSKDRLWVGTNDSGIALYENGEFRFYNRADGLTSLSVRAITEDGEGNIVVGTTDGLALIKDGELRMLDNPTVSSKHVNYLSRGKNGRVYGCTFDGVCFMMDRELVRYSFNSREWGKGLATVIIPDPSDDGTVWVGTDESAVIHGSIYNAMKDCDIYPIQPNTKINSLKYDPNDKSFWVCTDNGIGKLSYNGVYTNLDNYPLRYSVENVMTDYEGNLWFSSSRQGVMKVVPNSFTDINTVTGIGELVTNATYIYNDDLYIGTDSGLIVFDKDYNRVTNKLTEMLDGVRIRCMESDSKKRLWICTYSEKGLICYEDDDHITYFSTQNGLRSDRVRAICELSDGTIAAATSGGAALIKDSVVTKIYDAYNGLTNTEVLSVCRGDDDKIYLGTDGGGLFIVDRKNVVKHLGLEDGLKSEIIMQIKKDPYNSGYWIITGNSIAYMNNEKIRTINSFPYTNNFDIFFDRNDRAWILSSNGIYAVNTKKLLEDSGNLEYSLFDAKCGLPYAATANSHSCLSPDGTLYIAGMSGVSSININDQTGDDSKIKLSIPYIDVDGKLITVKNNDTVRIPADCRRITIYGFAPTFRLTNPTLSYCLEGFDTQKFAVSRQDLQPVSYTNLESGNYRFVLSAVDTVTGSETNSVSVSFVKSRAFFEQFWFWGLMILAALVIVLAMFFFRYLIKARRLAKQEKETNLFVNQMISAFAKCIDFKDKYTNGHSFRVAKYSAMIAERMGYDEKRVRDIYNIGLLHDIGKIVIPDEILTKPDRLTDKEFETMQNHTKNGYDILNEIKIRPELATGAYYHHEHIDGSGYPNRLRGSDIPEEAQIIAVADTFDAMNSTRPYRRQLHGEIIVNELIRISGTQLNSKITAIFLDLIKEGKLDEWMIWDDQDKHDAEVKSYT